MQVKLAHRGGSVRLRLRDDGASFYALQVTPSEVALLKRTHGAETPLGTPLPLAYPADEYLLVEFSVVGDRLSAAVDGITLFAGVAGDSAPGELQNGKRGAGGRRPPMAPRPPGSTTSRCVASPAWARPRRPCCPSRSRQRFPQDWTLVDGAKPWAIAPQGHRVARSRRPAERGAEPRLPLPDERELAMATPGQSLRADPGPSRGRRLGPVGRPDLRGAARTWGPAAMPFPSRPSPGTPASPRRCR